MIIGYYIHDNETMKVFNQYTEVFSALSDVTRLRIIYLLILSKESLCVCEIVDSLEEPESNISRHLKVLKHTKLVEERKEGRWKYYSITAGSDQIMTHLFQTITLIPREVMKKEYEQLQRRLKLRKDGKCLLGIQKSQLISSKKEG